MINERAGWRTRWSARLGAGVLWLLARTWRVRYLNRGPFEAARPSDRRVVFVIWHGELLPALWSHRRRNVSVLISEHRDGEIIARICHAFGFRTVRGSTTRGANRALVGLVRELANGFDVAVTPDGPKGPDHSFAAGALLVAQRAACPVVPVGFHASRAWRLRSWDRFMIPKPFARVTVHYARAMAVPEGNPRALQERTPAFRSALEAASEAAARGAP